MPRPLSVQLYTVRDQLVADREGTLRRLAGLGYGAVEAYDVLGDPKGLRRIVDDLGLAVSGTHAVQLLGPEPGPVLDAVATLGTDLAIVPAGIPPEEFTSRDGLARTADRLNSLADVAGRHGIRIGYHNHWWEMEPRFDDGGAGLLHAVDLLAGLLDPAVFLEVDTYWAAVGGADVPALLRRLGDRVWALHLKDGPGTKEDPNVAVGGGTMPVPEILAAAPDALRIVEFDSCAGDGDTLFDELAASRVYLASLAAA
ncbi:MULTISPECIES: sugar phosphate isomerase/epimerase [unclassified Streptomyces]|uniref:sugar phosphate isomerase/epimerase family protein n=1 Tax=unclassified Streptomyces TaxID=2593676 RepID=UPI0013696B11|nr:MULTISPECIES: sugar phosphate isomerase/epimerase [unclassified Streptomyces]NEA05026.1 sugar phosphate isomerase/epimerase [Streptomyces sp. SID10116]MYY87598.1 TIM barrel protein [Streptomyces sp. SID335]MYZ14149.1 TIM barrel protein [Streptomyces sp. SID337]NDZ88403.1 sugar phosphate isomerase/epimerase [Streptomyces sp. SID10115]NEB47087.1 sugar phosphate isomerase/epimerase [Streptomyces sp. SID339]